MASEGQSFQNSFYTSSQSHMISMPQDPSFPSEQYTNPFDLSALQTSQYVLQPGQSPMMPQSQSIDFEPDAVTGNLDDMFDDASTVKSATAPSSFSGQSPRLIDLLLPGTDLNARPAEYLDYRSRQSDLLYQPASQIQTDSTEQDGDNIEEIVRQPEANDTTWALRPWSPSSSNSSGSSKGSPPQDAFDLFSALYRQPDINPGSPEMLMVRFDRQTCGILSVKDGPTENPWRTLIWPLARESPALYHAIASMTAFHTSKEKPAMRVEGMEHMRQSIRSLASNIEGMRTETALATTLVLAFSESWDQHISTGIEHLRGAKVLVNQALTKHKQSSLGGDDLARLRFLCNTWVYMDVIARLTSIDDDESNDFDAALGPPCGPLLPNIQIDPLMGCAGSLFPLIGRVANLVRRVRKSESNTVAMISKAMELKSMIENWEPSSFFEPPEDPTSEIQHSLQTAEAYRWATLLYLHQAVPEIPSLSTASLAKKVLVFLATVPLSSRTIIVQIYPLLAAGCEAAGHEDRQWVQDRWAAMSQRMLIGNIDRCWEVMREVWDRRDNYEAEIRGRHPRLNKARTVPEDISSENGLKRKVGDELDLFDWSNEYGNAKRRATCDAGIGLHRNSELNQRRKRSMDNFTENMEFELTVRGGMHWVGVMKDWGWEGKQILTIRISGSLLLICELVLLG
ncbi:MAG: hypothetical protein M1827_001046 [Pycnora praestabilis]|nr:MAG: hypothetical protein M1827_001046 [Pycnora praestabilis]